MIVKSLVFFTIIIVNFLIVNYCFAGSLSYHYQQDLWSYPVEADKYRRPQAWDPAVSLGFRMFYLTWCWTTSRLHLSCRHTCYFLGQRGWQMPANTRVAASSWRQSSLLPVHIESVTKLLKSCMKMLLSKSNEIYLFSRCWKVFCCCHVNPRFCQSTVAIFQLFVHQRYIFMLSIV